jgi:hypothetical protein
MTAKKGHVAESYVYTVVAYGLSGMTVLNFSNQEAAEKCARERFPEDKSIRSNNTTKNTICSYNTSDRRRVIIGKSHVHT